MDDEPDILETLAPALEMRLGLPVRVDVAEDGLEAQRKIEAGGCYDMVISDERMPGLLGSELLDWMQRRCPSTVRVLMTAYLTAMSEDIRHTANPHLFFSKPFEFGPMFADLRRALLSRGPAPTA